MAGNSRGLIFAMLSMHAHQEPECAEIVKLHFFAGLTLDETADALAISRATVYRQWSYARACLRLMMAGADARPE
jgi:DNA-directed RNA polymerase specialized sigma24 family protein